MITKSSAYRTSRYVGFSVATASFPMGRVAMSRSQTPTKYSSRTESAILASSGERMPPWGVPVLVSLPHPILREDAGVEERLHQSHDTLVSDSMSHPLQ